MKRETLKRTISKILRNNISNLPNTDYSDITNCIMVQVDKYANEKTITEEQIKNQFLKKGWKDKGTSVVACNRTKIFNFEKATNEYNAYLGVDFDNLINAKDFGIGLTIKANEKDEERFCITGNFKSLADITSRVEKRISEYLNSIKH